MWRQWGTTRCIRVQWWWTERRRRAARRRHGAERRGGRRLHFPRPASPWAVRVFREGHAGPLAAKPGNRAPLVSVRLGRRSTTTPVTRYTRAHLSRTLESNASCTRAYRARGENSELVAGNGSWPVHTCDERRDGARAAGAGAGGAGARGRAPARA